ncbi:MAG: LPXTG cell wall anchor domain-containing protein [Erysipelothrix sp.]|nr:LPXTG cell wall anchor domain-containing protein [Erysipelothrix sp.]
MKKERSRWLYFLMSVGTIFIVLSPTEDGSAYHLILGLVLIGLSIMFLTKKKK